MRRYSTVLSVLGLMVLYFFASGSVHELGHLIALESLGMGWGNLRSEIATGKLFAVDFLLTGTIKDDIVRYSGGIFSAVFISGLYLVFRKSIESSPYMFISSIFIFAMAGFHFSQGIVEGAFHDEYISRNDILSVSRIGLIETAGSVLGVLIFLSFKFNKLVGTVRQLRPKDSLSKGGE